MEESIWRWGNQWRVRHALVFDDGDNNGDCDNGDMEESIRRWGNQWWVRHALVFDDGDNNNGDCDNREADGDTYGDNNGEDDREDDGDDYGYSEDAGGYDEGDGNDEGDGDGDENNGLIMKMMVLLMISTMITIVVIDS